MLPAYPDGSVMAEAALAVLGYTTNPNHALHGGYTLIGLALSFFKPDQSTAKAAPCPNKETAVALIQALTAKDASKVSAFDWTKVWSAVKLIIDLILAGS